MKIEIVISIISTAIASLSFLFAFYVYRKSRHSVKLKENQDQQMQIIASQAILFWEQIQILMNANVNKYDVDPYIYISLKQNAKRLEESIEKAISLGLWNTIVPKRKRNSDGMHVAFIQSLMHQSVSDIDTPIDWLKQHLIMGIVRLFEICENYEGLNKSLKDELEKRVSKEIRELSWVYIYKNEKKDLK
ncbi:MAG: hypothetical protein ABJL44_13505 [Algibacter sp.]